MDVKARPEFVANGRGLGQRIVREGQRCVESKGAGQEPVLTACAPNEASVFLEALLHAFWTIPV